MLKLISKHKWTIIGALVVVAVIAFFCRGYLSEPGLIGRNDVSYFFARIEQGEVFGQWFQTWSSEEITTGPRVGISYELFSPLYFLIAKLHLLPSSPSIAAFLFYVLASISCYLVVYYYTRNVYGSIAAGLLYSLNWTARSLVGSATSWSMGWALFPILFLLFDRVLEKGRVRDMALFSIFAVIFVTSTVYHGVYIAFCFLALFALFHVFLAPGRRLWARLFKTAKSALISVAMIAGLLGYILVPLFAGVSPVSLGRGYAAGEVLSFSNSMAVTFALEKGGHQPPALGSGAFVFMIVLAALVFSALLFRRDKYTIFFAVAALIGIFLAKGPHPPFAFIFNWLWAHFPGFDTFRDSGRWLMITAFAYAFLLGVSIKSIQAKLKVFFKEKLPRGPILRSIALAGVVIELKVLFQKKFPRGPTLLSIALLVAVIAMILLSLKPLITTHQERGYDPSNYPEYIEAEAAYNKIASENEGINSIYLIIRNNLVLNWDIIDPQTDTPWHQTVNPVRWLYPEGGQPMTGQIRMDINLWLSQFSRFMDYHVSGLTMADFSGILGSENIKYIMVDQRMWQYIEFFREQDDFDTFYEGETLVVFENKNVLPHLYATPASAKLFGGFNSLLVLPLVPGFSFSDINLLPPDSDQSSDFLILYNADAEEFAMLNALESEGAVQSLDIDQHAKLAWWRELTQEPLRYWVTTDWWTVRGDFVYGGLHLRTGTQDTIQIPFSVDESGDYEMWLRIAFALNRGELDALVDGEELSGFPLTPEADFDYGFEFVKATLYLETGEHVLELRNDGSGYNDVDEVFLLKSGALDSLLSAVNETTSAEVIYYAEAEGLFGLDNLGAWSTYSYLGPVETVADDDQSQFWHVFEPQVVSISDSTDIKAQGNDSLEITLSGKKNAYSTLQHNYDTPQDWSDKDCIALYFYGSDTKQMFGFEAHVQDGDEWEWVNFGWEDNFVGWKQLIFIMDKEALDWSKVKRIKIGMSKDPVITGTWYLDDLAVGNFTERPPVVVIRSIDETSPISASFRPLMEGDYMIAIRALATDPKEVIQHVPVSTIADDEQSQFWYVYQPEVVSVSDSTDIKVQGEDSLEITVSGDKNAWGTFEHVYSTPQDWSDADYFSLYFYGNDSMHRLALEAYNKDGEEWKWVNLGWFDDFVGWKQITLPIDKESLDWTRVEKVKIGGPKGSAINETWYLDGLTTGKLETTQVGGPEDTTLRLTINGESITFGGGDGDSFTTEFGWYEAGPIHLDDEPQTIELSNEWEVLIDKILLYPCESQSELGNIFNIDDNISLSYEKLSPTKYKVHVDTDEPFWLLFPEVYDSLWYAYVDGESIQSTQAYRGFNSFYISKVGEYDVVLEFKGQQYLEYGAIISGVILGFIVIGVIFSERRAKRKKGR